MPGPPKASSFHGEVIKREKGVTQRQCSRKRCLLPNGLPGDRRVERRMKRKVIGTAEPLSPRAIFQPVSPWMRSNWFSFRGRLGNCVSMVLSELLVFYSIHTCRVKGEPASKRASITSETRPINPFCVLQCEQDC